MQTIRDLAAATPAHRNRAVDLYRAIALLFVVLGHWLAAAIWVDPDGRLRFNTVLALADWTHWLTWIVQVMPVFFIVGGYSNWKSYDKTRRQHADVWAWITSRFRRLMTPVVPLVVVITMLVAATLAIGLDNRIVRSGAWNALVPLWFLAVYMILVACVPATAVLWRRWGWWSVVAGFLLAVATDLVRFAADADWIGWINFVFVWIAAHQIGYGWATEDRVPQRRLLVAGIAGAPVLLLVATLAGPYPLSMVAVPGAPENNTLPPTAVMLVIGVFQYALMRLVEPSAARWMQRQRPWTAVVAVSSAMMTIYVWHLTAVALVVLAGYGLGWGFDIEPLTAAWYVTRPLWLALLAAVLIGLIALFGRFEHGVREAVPPHPALVVGGAALFVTAIALAATGSIVTEDGRMRWLVPVLFAAGVIAVGAWPTRRTAR